MLMKNSRLLHRAISIVRLNEHTVVSIILNLDETILCGTTSTLRTMFIKDMPASLKQLSSAINGITSKIDEAKQQLESVRNEMAGKKASMEKVKPVYERFSGWAEEFMLASIKRKKMIISQLVSRIEISKGYKINIVLNLDYERFLDGVVELEGNAIL